VFLHVGYSVQDQHVIEANTAVTFRADSVADKLGTLLNEDSAEQVRHLASIIQIVTGVEVIIRPPGTIVLPLFLFYAREISTSG